MLLPQQTMGVWRKAKSKEPRQKLAFLWEIELAFVSGCSGSGFHCLSALFRSFQTSEQTDIPEIQISTTVVESGRRSMVSCLKKATEANLLESVARSSSPSSFRHGSSVLCPSISSRILSLTRQVDRRAFAANYRLMGRSGAYSAYLSRYYIIILAWPFLVSNCPFHRQKQKYPEEERAISRSAVRSFKQEDQKRVRENRSERSRAVITMVIHPFHTTHYPSSRICRTTL